MTMLAIDPGKRASGWAWFEGGVLVRAGYGRPTVLSPLPLQQLVIEIPSVRRLGKSRGDPNDLIAVAFAAGEWAGRFADARLTQYQPSEWKGQLPKHICHARALACLSRGEIERVPTLAKTRGGTDMWDAISIGLVHLDRLRMR